MLNSIDKVQEFVKTLEGAKQRIAAVFPIEDQAKTKRLEVTNLRWENTGADVLLDLQKQKKAKLAGQSINATLKGDVQLLDLKTNSVIDSATGYTVLLIPHITANIGYMINGKEVQIVNQFRWRPGLYARFTSDNDAEIRINTKAAGSYRIHLERATGEIYFKVGVSSRIPIVSTLIGVGFTDPEIRELLGEEIYRINAVTASTQTDLTKLIAKIRPSLAIPKTIPEMQTVVKSFFESKPLDVEVNKVTVNKPIDKIDKSAFAEGIKKVIALSKNEVKPDDVESLAFKTIHSLEDFILERLDIAIPSIRRGISYQLRFRDKISMLLVPGTFSSPITKFFSSSEFTRYSDQNNPLDIFSVNSLVTVLGDGGIGSTHAITDDIRAVHPSHIGVLDVLATPEGEKVGITNHLALGTKKIGQILHVSLYEAKTGKKVLKPVSELDKFVIAFPDQYKEKLESQELSGPPTPISDKVKVRAAGTLKEVRAKDVDYVFVSADAFFATSSVAVPFLNSNSANRVLMGDKHMEQAVNLVNPDKPLVQHRVQGRGYEEHIGEGLVPRAIDLITGEKFGGIVTRVTKDNIQIKDTKGKLRLVPLRNHFPLNSNTFLHDTPTVRVGQKIAPGQAVAENNFTKDGTLAIGKNLRVAFSAYKGYNFEDGTVISQSAANKLASWHKYELVVEKDTNTRVGAPVFIAAFPTEIESLGNVSERFDSKGFIKVGTKVTKGDLIIPAIRSIERKAQYDFKALHRKAYIPWANISEVWDSDFEGEIMDVIDTRNFTKVVVSAREPMQVGDKMAVRNHGAKGICHAPGTEALTANGWKKIEEITLEDEIATLNPNTKAIEYYRPDATIAKNYEGKLYQINTRRLELLTTPDHKHYVKAPRQDNFALLTSEEIFGRQMVHLKTGEWLAPDVETITIPGCPARPGQHETSRQPLTFKMDDFIEFFGYYITEGCVTKHSQINIAQDKNVNPDVAEKIEACITKLGFKINYVTSNKVYLLFSPQLHAWLSTFGKAHEKFIPRELLETSSRQLKILREAMIMGDGELRKEVKSDFINESFFTASSKLANDYQEILFKTGLNGSIFSRKRSDKPERYSPEFVVRRSTKKFTYVSSDNRYGVQQSWIDYSGPVYCLTVPNNIFYVRRNGKPVWSGNCVKILPDNEMYRDEAGNIIDVLLNPAGVPGRINPGQMLETAAGKLADKTGKVFYTDNFNSKESALKSVQDALAKENIKDAEILTDPITNETLPETLVGIAHVIKLKHSVSGKIKSRASVGEKYTVDQVPSKGGDSSAQRIGMLDTFTLLSGDAVEFLNDAFLIKSQKNDEYWQAVQSGRQLPPPQTPFIAEKFLAMLIASGIDLKQEGSEITALPLTDDEILSMSSGEIKRPLVVRANDLGPEKDGLYDTDITGGPTGSKWSHIKLANPVVNPLLVDAVASVGQFETKSQLEKVLNGELAVTPMGKITQKLQDGDIGGQGVINRLKTVNIDREIEETSSMVVASKGARRDKHFKRLRYLKALKKTELSPEKAYVLNNIAVLPPKFRQISPMSDGSLSVPDVVHTYREVLLVNEKIKELRAIGIDEENLRLLTSALNEAVTAHAGLTEPLTRGSGDAGFQGIIAQIKGSSPKFGFFQSKVQTRAQDLSARSTVIPNPKLDMDSVGLPKEIALKIYKPFIVRRLAQTGVPPITARQMAEDGSKEALVALEIEIKSRPVLMNRAPSLHKFSMLSFKPVLIDGQAIEVNPLVVGGFNMDFDGDQIFGNIIFSVLNADLDKVYDALAKNPELRYTLGVNVDYSNRDAIVRFFDTIKMTSRTNLNIPVKSGATVFCCDASEFPHLAEVDHVSIGSQGNLIRWHRVPEGVEVLAHDSSAGELVWRPVTLWSEHVDCPVEIVKLSNGKELYTDNDPRAVYGISRYSETLEPERARPREAKASRFAVPYVCDMKLPEEISSINFSKLGADRDRSKRRLNNKETPLTSDVGYAFGALIGDGWVGHSAQTPENVCLANVDMQVVEKIGFGLNILMTEQVPAGIHTAAFGNSYGHSVRATWSSTALAEAVLPLIGKGAAGKHLPAFALMAVREFKLGLLAGLIDTDGTVTSCKATSKKSAQTVCNYSTNSFRLAREVVLLCRSLEIGAGISSTKTPSGSDSWVVTINPQSLKSTGLGQFLNVCYKKEALENVTDLSDSNISGRFDAVPFPIAVAKELKKFVKPLSKAVYRLPAAERSDEQNQRASLYVVVSRSTKDNSTNTLSRFLAKQLVTLVQDKEVSGLVKKWVSIVNNSNIRWASVIDVEVTDARRTGHDLTVPGFETFTNVEGIVLSNTAGIHVPVSEEAREEALTKLLPSKNLFSPRDSSVVHGPTKETLLGLYLMTMPKGEPTLEFSSPKDVVNAYNSKKIKVNTAIKYGGEVRCAGQFIFEEALPSQFRSTTARVITKKESSKLMERMGRELGDQAAQYINTMKDLGNRYVTEVGFSVSLKDLEIDTEKRDKIIDRMEKNIASKGFDAAADQAQKEITMLVAEATDNRFVEATMKSGALGKSNELSQMIGSPVAMTDHNGKVIPMILRKSFVEGHDLASYLGSTPGSRKGLIDKGLSVADTGYLNRLMVNSAITYTIKEKDCGSTLGTPMKISDPQIHDRYGAKEPYRNVLLTSSVTFKAAVDKETVILVRSPLTCKTVGGVCALCFGLTSEGALPRIGFHVGALAGQTIGERATQTMLRAFHHGGAVGAQSMGFDRIKQILEMPGVVKNSAVLAKVPGSVTKIDPAPAGGFYVYIGTTKHFITQELGLKVKVGSSVLAGDQLSAYGTVKPQDILETTGDIKLVQNYLINELEKNYGGTIKRKIFETAVKPLTDKAQVTDAGGAIQFNIHPGDIVQINQIEQHNERLRELKKPLIQYEPLVVGIKQAPYYDQDFVGSLTHEKLQKTLERAPALGLSTNLSHGHPMAQLALKGIKTIENVKRPVN